MVGIYLKFIARPKSYIAATSLFCNSHGEMTNCHHRFFHAWVQNWRVRTESGAGARSSGCGVRCCRRLGSVAVGGLGGRLWRGLCLSDAFEHAVIQAVENESPTTEISPLSLHDAEII